MSQIDALIGSYRRHMESAHSPRQPPPQRVWFAVYAPEDERRLHSKLTEFELCTHDAGHLWHSIDLRGQFSAWLRSVDSNELHDWFRNPRVIKTYAKTGFQERLVAYIRAEMAKSREPTRTVFAVTGLMELFDYRHVSELLGGIEPSFEGFLLVFFPGEREENTYRFLGARDGWDYLAVPIVSER